MEDDTKDVDMEEQQKQRSILEELPDLCHLGR